MSRPTPGSERGFTLVELLITMVLTTVVLGITLDFLVTMNNVDARAGSVEIVTRDVRLVLRSMSEDIRSAASIATSIPTTGSCTPSSTYANCLQFTVVRSDSATTPNCPYSVITYGLKGGAIREDRSDYRLSGSSCVLATASSGRKVLANVPAGVTTIFTFYDHTGAPIAPANVVGGTPPNSNVSSILVNVASSPTHGAPVTLASLAALRNSR